jgi:hypothetical protein
VDSRFHTLVDDNDAHLIYLTEGRLLARSKPVRLDPSDLSDDEKFLKEFTAHFVAAMTLEDLDTFVCVLAEREDGQGPRLELQRGLSADDEQDRGLGMDTYCLCTETQACHYGGVLSYELKEKTLLIHLDAEASQALDVDEGFAIRLEISAEYLQALAESLPKVFVELLH